MCVEIFPSSGGLEPKPLPAKLGSLVTWLVLVMEAGQASPRYLGATCSAAWVRVYAAVTPSLCAVKAQSELFLLQVNSVKLALRNALACTLSLSSIPMGVEVPSALL